MTVRAIILLFSIAAFAPLPPTTVTPTEARGLAMLHQLRAAYPEPTCPEECKCDEDH
jgi:hypothetical protein